MSIYKLKLGFSRLFDGLWMYPRVYGPAHIKAWCFGPLKWSFKTQKIGLLSWPNFKWSLLTRYKSKLGNIFVQIEAQNVYFPMKQNSLKILLWIKDYGQNNEKMSFFSITFKAILALLSCDYFQTIKITSITFCRYVELIIRIGA